MSTPHAGSHGAAHAGSHGAAHAASHGAPFAPYAAPHGATGGASPEESAAGSAARSAVGSAVGGTEAAPAGRGGRDRYLDTLRALALVRVIVFHVFGWTWLTVVFPSMGVMFALAGSLMARSLGQRGAVPVIRGRVRRLLPPMWVFGLVVVGMLVYTGWHPSRDGGGVTGIVSVLNWIVPLGAPPYPDPAAHPWGWLDSSWADQVAGPLWYIRAYLWFVLASPLLLRLFRRAPWAALGLPLALCAVFGTGLVTLPGETGEAVTDFATYGACWVLGFAHHDGLFRKVPRYVTVSAATFAMAAGLWWASGHLTSEGWNLDEIPLGQALWSLGFVAVLLLYSPSWRRLPGRLATFDSVITLANNRAVTIYLWHNLLIMAAVPVIDQAWRIPGSDRFGSVLDASYSVLTLVLVFPMTAVVILLLGWFEDLAAGRRPRLWPNGARERRRSAGTAAAPARTVSPARAASPVRAAAAPDTVEPAEAAERSGSGSGTDSGPGRRDAGSGSGSHSGPARTDPGPGPGRGSGFEPGSGTGPGADWFGAPPGPGPRSR